MNTILSLFDSPFDLSQIECFDAMKCFETTEEEPSSLLSKYNGVLTCNLV